MARPAPKSTPGRWGGPQWAGRRVGIFGGSFNPAHDGHVQLSLHALKSLDLDAVWWLVSPQNPLKAGHNTLPIAERVARAQAIARHPRLYVGAMEQVLGTVYTLDTLNSLHRRYPRTQFVWLMGADNMIQMPQWRHWTRILTTTPIAVFARPPYSLKALHGKLAIRYRRHRCYHACVFRQYRLPAWMYVPMMLNAQSSSRIRAAQQQFDQEKAP